jgi:hypothetical protein
MARPLDRLISDLDHLAFTGDLAKLIKFRDMHGTEPIRASRHAMLMAAMQNNLRVVEWLHAHGAAEAESCAYAAASRGHLPVVQWLYENVRECVAKGYIAQTAADNGHVAVTAWLHERGIAIPYINTAMNRCAERGDTVMLDWLHAHGADTENLHKLPLRYKDKRTADATSAWCEKMRRQKIDAIVASALNQRDAATTSAPRRLLKKLGL